MVLHRVKCTADEPDLISCLSSNDSDPDMDAQESYKPEERSSSGMLVASCLHD